MDVCFVAVFFLVDLFSVDVFSVDVISVDLFSYIPISFTRQVQTKLNFKLLHAFGPPNTGHRSKPKYSWQCLTVSMLLILNSLAVKILRKRRRIRLVSTVMWHFAGFYCSLECYSLRESKQGEQPPRGGGRRHWSVTGLEQPLMRSSWMSRNRRTRVKHQHPTQSQGCNCSLNPFAIKRF